jgi:hypothetical protein
MLQFELSATLCFLSNVNSPLNGVKNLYSVPFYASFGYHLMVQVTVSCALNHKFAVRQSYGSTRGGKLMVQRGVESSRQVGKPILNFWQHYASIAK